MPFASVSVPSIQLGLLKPIACSHGFPVETFHLNLDFARQVGCLLYERLAEDFPLAVGDWLFSLAAFRKSAPDAADRFVERFAERLRSVLSVAGVPLEHLLELRHETVPRYLDQMLESVPWDRFRVVGFTSTFQQTAASVALARAIKDRYPDVITLFGGANFEDEMGLELIRSIEGIDYVISGEADLAFPELLVALSEEDDVAAVPSVLCRHSKTMVRRSAFAQLDELPVPDYEEFFTRAESLGLLPPTAHRLVPIPFESARGCWWGAKRHCVFCGLNGTTMAFRAKSPARVEAELAELARRCRSFHFIAVDNILERSYIDSLFPRLVASGATYRIRYEVKADLTRSQLKVLREAGVWMIQPGIESLSSRVLRLMRKGTRAWQNVNLLRWSAFYGIHVIWNLIWGFPGETEEDYRQQAGLMRAVVHLEPPNGHGRIRMDRFSPIFSDREAFPASGVRPAASYGYVYPATVDLRRAAYYFDCELEATLPDAAFDETLKLVDEWRRRRADQPQPSLKVWTAPGFIQIDDHRDPDHPGTYTFSDPLASLYLACSERAVTAKVAGEGLGLHEPPEAIEAVLDEFTARGLMMRDGNLFLALAIPAAGGRPEEESPGIPYASRPSVKL
jgi:ribosomal peptide maturation radical SAM protein 1